MDAEVENAADHPATEDAGFEAPAATGADEQSWLSWFGKGTSHVAPDSADDEDADQQAGDDLVGTDVADDPEPDRGAWPSLRSPRRPPVRVGQDGPSPLLRSLISPHLRVDPRTPVWITRTAISLALFSAITIWTDWRFGVTAVVIYVSADIVYRSRTTGVTPTSVRVTSAQRRTGRRLRMLRTAGYVALHARTIPETGDVIDHVVVGPSGIYTLDSQVLDARLSVRVRDGELFHGPGSQAAKIEHARFEAQRAAQLIASELGQRIRVRPAMVLYGPFVPWVIMRINGVDILDGRHVGLYFRRESKAAAGHELDQARVALVYAAAAHALPPLH